MMLTSLPAGLFSHARFSDDAMLGNHVSPPDGNAVSHQLATLYPTMATTYRYQLAMAYRLPSLPFIPFSIQRLGAAFSILHRAAGRS
jgi:hypothetical protein